MLVIRLLRVGKKNQPVFRIVVTEKKNAPKSGSFLEIVGFYNPITKEKNLKTERIKYWLSVGAQPSDTVHNLLVTGKIIEAKKVSVHKKKKVGAEKPAKEPAKETLTKKDEAESPKKEKDKKPEEAKPEESRKEEKPAVSVEAPAPPTERGESLAPKGREETPKEDPKKDEKLEEKPAEKQEEKSKKEKPEEKPKEGAKEEKKEGEPEKKKRRSQKGSE